MDQQPSELVLKQFLALESEKDIINLSKSNRYLYEIYKENENTIYQSLIKKEFNIELCNFKKVYGLLKFIGKDNMVKRVVESFNVEDNESNVYIKNMQEKLINIQNNEDGVTPLMEALYLKKSPEIINRILDIKNIDMTIRNNRNSSSLMFALDSEYDLPIILRILDTTQDIDIVNEDNNTALTFALESYNSNSDDNVLLINKLIDMVSSINKKTYDTAVLFKWPIDILDKLWNKRHQ